MTRTLQIFTILCLSVLTAACTPLVDTMGNSDAEPSPASEASSDEASLGMPTEAANEGAIVNGYRFYDEAVLANGNTKVLFFHAPWCPYCQEKDENLRTWYETEQIPLRTYRLDFDTETELRGRFGVTQQDTFVVVDGSGKAVATLTSPSLGDLKRVLYGNMGKLSR